jgi:antitoxin (DNA-binding transcriptional repressor) of toxin-antitoxin stability system
MKTMSIRDLRRSWAKVEVALRTEAEIMVTRYSKPVAKLVYIAPNKTKRKHRKRWDPVEHMRWMKKVYGNKILPSSDAIWASARADRWETL